MELSAATLQAQPLRDGVGGSTGTPVPVPQKEEPLPSYNKNTCMWVARAWLPLLTVRLQIAFPV